MKSGQQLQDSLNRRTFLGQAGLGFGACALSSLLAQDGTASEQNPGLAGLPHFRRKRSG